MNMKSPEKNPVVVLVATALLLSMGGCAEEERKREYAVPDSLCGVRVGAEVIEPFMPSGKRIYQSEDEAGTIIWSCDVSVDGEKAFQISRDRWEPGWSTRRFAVTHASVRPENEAADKSYVYSDEGAVATIRCTEQGGERDLFLAARVRGAGVPDDRAMEKFITAYREEFLKSDPCAEE